MIRARTSEARERAKVRGVKPGRKPKLTEHQKREAIRRRDIDGETVREIPAATTSATARFPGLQQTDPFLNAYVVARIVLAQLSGKHLGQLKPTQNRGCG